jgi:putative oxidoreductase
MLAAMFVYGGLDAFRNPKSKARRAERVAPKIADAAGVDADTVQLVRFNGAVQVGAGTALALGVMPRLAALTLAGSLVPTTLAGHRFWEEEDPTARAQQTVHFLKNVGILGGLVMVVSEGK